LKDKFGSNVHNTYFFPWHHKVSLDSVFTLKCYLCPGPAAPPLY
jgi:hypothetical protein